MDNTSFQSGNALIKYGLEILRQLSRKERIRADEIEFVFVDTVNGRTKQCHLCSMLDILKEIEEGGKPIGVLLMEWNDPEHMVAKPFPGITTEEQELLHHALAEAQDEAHEGIGDGD